MMSPISNPWQHPSKAIDATTMSKETGVFDAISWATGWADPGDDKKAPPVIGNAPASKVAKMYLTSFTPPQGSRKMGETYEKAAAASTSPVEPHNTTLLIRLEIGGAQ